MKKFVGNEALLYAVFPNNNIKVISKSHTLEYYDIKETKPYILELELEIQVVQLRTHDLRTHFLMV